MVRQPAEVEAVALVKVQSPPVREAMQNPQATGHPGPTASATRAWHCTSRFSTIEQPPAQSSQGCTQHGSDQCGCEGRSCPVGQSCLQVVELMTASEPAYSLNRCFSVCTTDAECGERQTCEVRRYGVKSCGAPFECHDDADCAREPGGVCAPVWGGQAHGGVRFQTGVQCVYPGSCDKTSCDGCYGEPTCHSCPWP